MATPGNLPIIAYHFVSAPGFQYAFSADEVPWVTDLAVLEARLEGLAQAGFATTRLEQYCASRDLPPQPMVLTFDDGHASFRDVALGLLTRYGFTATLFMTTDFIGKPGYLTGEQLAKLSRQGIEIGSHGCSHLPLTALPVLAMGDELQRSKRVLEEITGAAVAALALPYGFGSRAVERAAGDAGYETICTSRFGLNPVPRRFCSLSRISVMNALPWAGLQRLLRPESAAYRRALVRDRVTTAIKRIVGTDKRLQRAHEVPA